MKKFAQLLLLFSLYSATVKCQQEKIKIYALYSDSHATLVDNWFFPSLEEINDPLLELVLEKVDQECTSGNFMEQGWTNAMISKVDLIIWAIERTIKEVGPNQIFIYADVDIQFFEPFAHIILNLMKDNDMIIQRDSPQGVACAGFFACRANEKTLALWKAIRSDMMSGKEKEDQNTMNKYLKKGTFKIKWALLPAKFYSGGTLTGKYWNPGTVLRFPNEPLILHHANWTKGLQNKIAQLRYVKAHAKHKGTLPEELADANIDEITITTQKA